jgi:hypothetical protein
MFDDHDIALWLMNTIDILKWHLDPEFVSHTIAMLKVYVNNDRTLQKCE